MIDSFNHWATTNPDTAYLIGFSIIVAMYHFLAPYTLGLNVATSRVIPFKSINVWGQIRKRHRLALSGAAVALFAFCHFVLGAPLLALLAGASPIAWLTFTDYRQMSRDGGVAS